MNFVNLSVILLLFMLGGGVQAGTLVPNKAVDISFDGLCDGLSLSINQKTGVVTGTYISDGCAAEFPIVGTVGSLSKLGAGLTVLFFDSVSNNALIIVLDDSPRKWTVYSPDGSIFNSGTYSKGAPVPSFVGLPSITDF